MLDRQLHKCIVDRKISGLPELAKEDEDSPENVNSLTIFEFLIRFFLNTLQSVHG